MPISATDRRAIKRQIRQLRSLVNIWNPWGLWRFPEDEYDFITHELFGLLVRGADEADLAAAMNQAWNGKATGEWTRRTAGYAKVIMQWFEVEQAKRDELNRPNAG